MMRDKLAIEVVQSRDGAIELKEAERTVFRGVRGANLLSYGLIALLVGISLVITLVQ